MAVRNERVENDKEHGHASVSQTIINMAKTCMGTGCLALPFATKQGGILLHVFGLLGVAVWNAVTVQRLCLCYDLVLKPLEPQSLTLDLVEEETRPLKTDYGTASASPDYCSATTQSHCQSKPSEQNLTSIVEEEQPPKEEAEPPKGTTTLVKLAWYALGQWGANVLDVVMVLYMIGVIVTYLNGTRSFLSDTVVTTGIGFLDSFLMAAIMASLSIVPHTGRLAKASAMGLLVLLVTFLVIAWYGFFVPPPLLNPDATTTPSSKETIWHVLTSGSPGNNDPTSVSKELSETDEGFWLPHNGIAGMSKWFGIVVFGFGVAPLTFNFRQGMEEPHYLVGAAWWAMLLVAGSYIVIGVGLWYPFPDIDGDVLHQLPSTGFMPTLTRLAMVLVVLVTAPLLIVPCGELLEGKLVGLGPHGQDHGDVDDHGRHHWKSPGLWRIKAGVRWGICLICAAISTFVPGFVNVLSFVGCCCVALVGFCLPPFLHLILSIQKAKPRQHPSNSCNRHLLSSSLAISLFFDLALLLWGLLATVVSTIFTFREISSGK